MPRCDCCEPHVTRHVVLTGGPGAGKTAALELIRQSVCHHVRILPEAAGIIFGGGFPRDDAEPIRRSAQRAIFHVQRELEATGNLGNPAVVVCDRGSLDCLAYWPGDTHDFWTALGTTAHAELQRYDMVIHLRVPTLAQGYNHINPLRTESADAAAAIDARIADVWAQHPRRFVVESSHHFIEKAAKVLQLLQRELPECCAHHTVDTLRRS